ncbi:hypothetical protein [Azotobacter vinelandii]
MADLNKDAMRKAAEAFLEKPADGQAMTYFRATATPAAVLALIAENEEMARRIRFFELVHGGRASELVREMEHLRAEVRRLKILAGEDVPPLPEEFVGPMPERPYSRLRRKLQEQQKSAGGAGAAENCRCNEKLQELQAELERVRADAELLRKHLAECADSLESEILDRYGPSKDHPAMRRKFERDMQDVIEARAAMGKGGRADV